MGIIKLGGLYNQPGRGRKKTFNSVQEQQIKDWVKATPKSLEKVPEKIQKQWEIKVSKKTIKRVILISFFYFSFVALVFFEALQVFSGIWIFSSVSSY